MSYKNLVIGLLVVTAWMPALSQPWTSKPSRQNASYFRTTQSVVNYGPAPGSVVTVTQPPVIAEFRGTAYNVRMWVDGKEVTQASRLRNESITWNPPYALDEGNHNVQVSGQNAAGQAISGNWNFVVDSNRS